MYQMKSHIWSIQIQSPAFIVCPYLVCWATVFFIFSLTGDFEKKWSRGEKFVQSIHIFFKKVTRSQTNFIFDFYFFVDYNFYCIL